MEIDQTPNKLTSNYPTLTVSSLHSLTSTTIPVHRQQRSQNDPALRRGKRIHRRKQESQSNEEQSQSRSREKRNRKWTMGLTSCEDKLSEKGKREEESLKEETKLQKIEVLTIYNKEQNIERGQTSSNITKRKRQVTTKIESQVRLKNNSKPRKNKTQSKGKKENSRKNKQTTKTNLKREALQRKRVEDESIKAKIEQYFSAQGEPEDEEADPISIKGFWKSRYWKDIEHLFGRKRVQKILKLSSVGDIRKRAFSLIRLEHLFQNKYGSRLTIDIDDKCKYYDQFNVRYHQLEKKGIFYCQIYNKEPIPSEGRHYFEVRVRRLTLRMVIVGVITPANFQQQYSSNKPNCICFNGYTHSIYEQGKQVQLQVKPKKHDLLRIVVEIPDKVIEFYINHDLIWSGRIPAHMLQEPLFPYFETSNKSVKIKINKFEEGMRV